MEMRRIRSTRRVRQRRKRIDELRQSHNYYNNDRKREWQGEKDKRVRQRRNSNGA